MGRYSYIPLNYNNLGVGSEREILIKRGDKHGDLYLLDDYKVPVSITSYLHDNVDGLDNGVKELVKDSYDLQIKFQGYIKELITLGEKIDKLIKESENEIYSRITGLEAYKNYLKSYYLEVNDSYNDIVKQLRDTLNNYKGDVTGIVNAIQTKYNNCIPLYNRYVTLCDTYWNKLTSMETEMNAIIQKLSLKMERLGEGSGSFSGNKDVTVDKVIELTTWVYWMSNSEYGPWYGGSWDDPPMIPDLYGGIWRPIFWTDGYTAEELRPMFTQDDLAACYWGGPLLHKYWFVSSTPLLNCYARQCNMLYRKTIQVTDKKKFKYVVK